MMRSTMETWYLLDPRLRFIEKKWEVSTDISGISGEFVREGWYPTRQGNQRYLFVTTTVRGQRTVMQGRTVRDPVKWARALEQMKTQLFCEWFMSAEGIEWFQSGDGLDWARQCKMHLSVVQQGRLGTYIWDRICDRVTTWQATLPTRRIHEEMSCL